MNSILYFIRYPHNPNIALLYIIVLVKQNLVILSDGLCLRRETCIDLSHDKFNKECSGSVNMAVVSVY